MARNGVWISFTARSLMLGHCIGSSPLIIDRMAVSSVHSLAGKGRKEWVLISVPPFSLSYYHNQTESVPGRVPAQQHHL